MTTTQYVLYLRKSKGRAGITRQRTITTAHIHQLGGQITAEFADTDRTAYRKPGAARPEREGYGQMLAYLRAHPGTGIAAWHADRLTRDGEDTEELIRLAAAGGHVVETPRGGTYDLATATGRKRLRSDAVDAAYEVDHAIERITAAKAEAAAAGQWLGGRRPFGYEADGVTIRAAEARALREATEAVINGASLREIARRWNTAGITTAGGKPWTARDAGRVLRRPRNAALMEHKGTVTGPATWPAIVTETQWRAVTAILGDPTRRTTPGPGRRWLLSGIAVCGICGAPLTVTATSGKGRPARPVYRCRSASGTSQHVARDAATLDGWVTAVVLGRLGRGDITLPAPDPGAAQARAELAALRGELDDLARAAGAQQITVRQMAIVSARLQEQIAALEARIAAAARTSVLAAFRDGTSAAGTWAGLTLAQRRAVITELCTVTVHPAPRGRPPGWRPGQPYFRAASVSIAPRMDNALSVIT